MEYPWLGNQKPPINSLVLLTNMHIIVAISNLGLFVSPILSFHYMLAMWYMRFNKSIWIVDSDKVDAKLRK